MNVSDIYVHDGTLLRVIEKTECSQIFMEVDLPDLEQDEKLVPRTLVFDDVYGYRVEEGCINGCSDLLNISAVGTEGRWTWVRVDTNVGFREILCASVRVEVREPVAF